MCTQSIKGLYHVDTRAKKSEFIKIRVTLEQKEKFKKLAEEKGVTITELICGYIEKEIGTQEYKKKNDRIIENRSNLMEEKIKILKEKMKW